ncbi:MAG: FAD-binding oxidoreductase [Pseudomonadota bacterium]
MSAITDQAPIAFADAPPAQVDVAIIGGGVIGVAAALSLAEAGVSVALLEKGRIAGEQSSRNWGWVRQLGRDPAEGPLMAEARRLWTKMAARLGEDVGFRAVGVTYLRRAEADLAALEGVAEAAEHLQIPVERLDRAAVDRMIAGRPGLWAGGVRCPSDGRAEPLLAVPAMARAARRRGASITESCAARAFDLEAGRVAGVVTERGRVAAGAVLLAGGAWSSLMLERHGVAFAQLSVRATAARTAPAPNLHAGAAADEGLAFRRREDGGYTLAVTDRSEMAPGPSALRFAPLFLKSAWAAQRSLALRPLAPRGAPDGWATPRRWSEDALSPFERQRVLSPAPSRAALRRIRRRVAERLPALAAAPITGAWAGLIDATPDLVPTLDAVPGLPGLWLASGFSGHGFGIGPAAGRIMADLIQGRPAGHDLSRFRFERFSDGAPVRPGPAL